MSPDRKFFQGWSLRRGRDEQSVINETETDLQRILEEELRATDPYTYLAIELARIFPTERLVRNPVTNEEQIRKAILSAATLRMRRSDAHVELPEFVDIDEILLPYDVVEKPKKDRYGAIDTNIGIQRVLHYTDLFQQGGINLNPTHDQLRVDLVDGRYFATNGIYRVAALRALRIPFAPMNVRGTHH